MGNSIDPRIHVTHNTHPNYLYLAADVQEIGFGATDRRFAYGRFDLSTLNLGEKHEGMWVDLISIGHQQTRIKVDLMLEKVWKKHWVKGGEERKQGGEEEKQGVFLRTVPRVF